MKAKGVLKFHGDFLSMGIDIKQICEKEIFSVNLQHKGVG